jgi:hypothetical protein
MSYAPEPTPDRLVLGKGYADLSASATIVQSNVPILQPTDWPISAAKRRKIPVQPMANSDDPSTES